MLLIKKRRNEIISWVNLRSTPTSDNKTPDKMCNSRSFIETYLHSDCSKLLFAHSAIQHRASLRRTSLTYRVFSDSVNMDLSPVGVLPLISFGIWPANCCVKQSLFLLCFKQKLHRTTRGDCTTSKTIFTPERWPFSFCPPGSTSHASFFYKLKKWQTCHNGTNPWPAWHFSIQTNMKALPSCTR